MSHRAAAGPQHLQGRVQPHYTAREKRVCRARGKEEQEVEILSKYKPQQLDEVQVAEKVREAIASSGASSMQDMGKVMGVLKSSLAGSADMGLVSKIVKEELS